MLDSYYSIKLNMDYYKEFTAIAKEIGLKGKEMRDFIEEKVSIAEEKEKLRIAEEKEMRKIAKEEEKLKIAREEEMRKIAKEEERQKQIIEREERAARRELEQIKNDNLKLKN